LQFVDSVPRIIHRSATGLSPLVASAELSLDFDDHGAVLSRAADVLDRVGDLIERVGAGDTEFCGQRDGDGGVGGAAFGCDAAEPAADG
jgi:hypothetical protein